MKCSKCVSLYCVKAGFNHNRQRYKYRNCGRQFTQTQDKNATKRAFALYLCVVGLSICYWTYAQSRALNYSVLMRDFVLRT